MADAVLPVRAWAAKQIRVVIEADNIDVVAAQLASPSKERVVVDLTVGSRFERNGGSERRLSKKLTLRPGEAVRIQTSEMIETPADVFGLTVSKATLAGDGLFVSNLKIDPVFTGKLRIPVFNASRQRIVIKPGQQFASIYFVALESDPDDSDVRRVSSETKALESARFTDFIAGAAPYLISAAVSVITALVVFWITGK